MVRPILYETVLFLLPFVLYAIWLAFRKVNPAELETWREAPLLALLVAALVTTAVGLGLLSHFGGAPAGSVYVPARLEDGKLIGPELR
jgi:uncharacterized membrane protein YfcA